MSMMSVRAPAQQPRFGATRKKADNRRVAEWVSDLSLPEINWRWVAVILMVSGIGLTLNWLTGRMTWPVQEVRFNQVLVYQDHQTFQALLDQQIGRNLLENSLAELKQTVEALPWIASAEISFQWPGVLYVTVSEEKPVAIWNKTQLISQTGKLFQADITDFELPELSGNEASLESVMAHYLNFNRSLLSAGQIVSRLDLNQGGAWTVTTESGLEIRLGSEDVLGRFNRALSFIAGMAGDIEKIRYIDARYNNGVAFLVNQDSRVETSA